jgi:hypothetical protein
VNKDHDNPAEEIASIPGEDGYVPPAPAAWADLHKLTEERDILWARVKVLETEGDVGLRRRADIAEAQIEKLIAEVGRLKAEATACWEIRKSLIAEIAETDKALKDALTLIVYLSSRVE